MVSFQKTIEHDSSDELLAARHELVNCHALAMELVSRGSKLVRLGLSKGRMIKALFWPPRRDKLVDLQRRLDEIIRLYESVAVMRVAHLQEPFNADTAGKMQHELLEITQQEIRAGLRTHEENMQNKLASLEHRIVESVREMLPGIIREEMRKLLAEQREDANM